MLPSMKAPAMSNWPSTLAGDAAGLVDRHLGVRGAHHLHAAVAIALLRLAGLVVHRDVGGVGRVLGHA